MIIRVYLVDDYTFWGSLFVVVVHYFLQLLLGDVPLSTSLLFSIGLISSKIRPELNTNLGSEESCFSFFCLKCVSITR